MLCDEAAVEADCIDWVCSEKNNGQIGQPATAVRRVALWSPRRALVPRQEQAAQFAARHRVQRVVDGFVGHVPSLVVGVASTQFERGLLRRPAGA